MKARAAALWQRHARRIDDLSLRERAILFVSIAVALVGAVDALLLSPGFAEHKAALATLQQRAQELTALRVRVSSGGGASPQTAALAALQAEHGRVDAEIGRRLADAGGARLPELLQRVLRRHDRLTLLKLATLDDDGKDKTPGALPLQTVELALRGSYPDLTRYVADTEDALPALRWSALQITSGSGAAPMLTARLQLLGDIR